MTTTHAVTMDDLANTQPWLDAAYYLRQRAYANVELCAVLDALFQGKTVECSFEVIEKLLLLDGAKEALMVFDL